MKRITIVLALAALVQTEGALAAAVQTDPEASIDEVVLLAPEFQADGGWETLRAPEFQADGGWGEGGDWDGTEEEELVEEEEAFGEEAEEEIAEVGEEEGGGEGERRDR
jgi:hypothetical protein